MLMKKRYTLLMLCLMALTAWAAPNIQSGTAYRLCCRQYGMGAVVTGSAHSQSTPVYYATDGESAADAYWVFTEQPDGSYTIRNKSSYGYMTYTDQYGDMYGNVYRYLALSYWLNDTYSQWTFEGDANNGYVLRNVGNPAMVLNVRHNTLIVGGYTSAGNNQNERFDLYDAQGNAVTDLDVPPAPTETIKDAVTLKLNDKPAVYETGTGYYLHTIPEIFMGGNDFVAWVEYPAVTEGQEFTLHIDGTPVANGSDYTFEAVEGGKHYELTLFEGDTEVATTTLTFTSLPIVEINGYFSSYYMEGSIRVNQWDTPGADTLYRARLKHRGATASGKPKKAYAVKIIDDLGESKDVSFLGLRSDNNWILDAAYVDRSRMRNRVSTDLWNDFASPSFIKADEPKSLNGTRGGFVEVLLNGAYNGLYCMTEKIDRKQLQIRKFKTETNGDITLRGLLYKSNQWSYSVLMGHSAGSKYYPMNSPTDFSNYSATWDNWEMKYPDLEDGEPIDWAPLWNAINLVASANDRTFQTDVDKYFDLPVLLDYYLLLDLTLATDNHGKNLYWYCYNKQLGTPDSKGNTAVKLSLVPWDFDGCWGRRWDGSSNYNRADQDLTTMLWNLENGELTLYKRLRELDYKGWNDSLALRYATLRQGAFHADSLKARFHAYFDQFDVSGAGDREDTRWVKNDATTLDFAAERIFLDNWIDKRLTYLDEQYDIATVGIRVDEADDTFSATGGRGAILFRSAEARRVSLYDAAGRLVRHADLREGYTEVNNLPRGIYVVEGRKVMVR